MNLVTAFLLVSFPTLCVSFRPPQMFGGRPSTGFRVRNFDAKTKAELDSSPYTTPWNFTQKLDHFDSSNTATWTQRYWHSDKFAKPNGPQFLMMGGEGPGSYYDVVYEKYPHILWAMNVSAGLWALEHRFYGGSRPFPQQTTENLKYLTSRQYLADVANFIKYQNQQLGLTNPQWVIFGASYSGALALWFRELYPDVAVGAVGSSGPVYAKLDFYEYLQVVEASIRTYDNTCAQNVKIAFQKLETYMTSQAGRDRLTYYFSLVPAFKNLNITYEDIENFYSTAIGNFQTAVQYSRVNSNLFKNHASIPELCKIMNTPAADPVMNIVWFYVYMTEIMESPFQNIDNQWQDTIQYLQNTGYENEGQAATRSWTWQTCNEFGYFQSTDAGGNIFGSKVPNNLYIDMCTEVFGP
uniref:Serine carboxypeptidase n=1 Tax=Panagrolaimus sp. JU765 TaxID=591449 RepID=A0AC34QUG9_9BILA